MVLGIDLGTTYSVGAYIKDDGNVEIINNSEGNTLTPSVVMFDTDDGVIVGEVAKANAVMRPDDVVTVIKNHMGDKKYHKTYNGKDYTPEMISSFIIRKIVQDAERASGEKVHSVVVTVPAYFTDAKRKATEDAVSLAGVSLVGMINEPTAAALCYIKKQNVKNKNLLIYDLGGGTFDVTLLHVKDCNEIKVLSTGGLSNVGGRFFDQFIVDYVCDCMKEKYNIDLEDDEYVDELQEVYLKAENIKIQLSLKSKADIFIRIGKIKEVIPFTREQFEEKIYTMYGRTESKIKEALKEAGLSTKDIDKVLLVGGSSRIPYIVERIQQFIGQEPSKEVNPDEAVAIGAAIYANVIGTNDNHTHFIDVCSHSIGVVVYNEKGIEENNIIIPRNSTLPIQKEEMFCTIIKNQKQLSLKVTEGEYKELEDVTIIGNIDIQLPNNLPQNTLIKIRIVLDEYQLVQIYFELPDVGIEQKYCIKRMANMDEEMVENITGMLRAIEVN